MRDSALEGVLYDYFNKENRLGNSQVAACLKSMSDACGMAAAGYQNEAFGHLELAEQYFSYLPYEYYNIYRRAHAYVAKRI
jgi:hypothetical protein